MSNTNASAKTATDKPVNWVNRFGTMTGLRLMTGRKGRFAIVTIDCTFETREGLIFKDDLIQAAIEAGEGARVKISGISEAVTKKNKAGRSYSETVLRIVKFEELVSNQDETGTSADTSTSADTGTSANTGTSADTGTSALDVAVIEDDEIPF